ncbi:Peptide-N4-(N-acetyl-beta-glucosaminyl)asparagine amidase A [Parasponia andersonii]|uniref:Peptide-N4-(N-acetyl-beta-glucosaminyl)asparagine amidase A n=1 Tax=Parasponia andersonii TaxID=3476 RepID=A0A2P5A5X4_PARAD|nr:Peptide-N4-(N-acetyl-beta-glucosaminyl)asparagine amidase A [Parasponia andersonii]
MASSSPFPLLFVCLFLLFLLLHQPLFSNANLHKLRSLRPDSLSQLSTPPSNETPPPPPTHYFEVTRPIKLPKTTPCSHVILRHDFGFTYGKSPVLATYTPPSHCSLYPKFSKIVLEWRATCKGRQFDRIFGVWLGGVEILRSCTAEPRATGIVWSVEKDITRYYSLLLKNQTLAVYLGNLVDKTYTGVYHVNVTLRFYPPEENFDRHGGNREDLVPGYDSWADLVLPISRNLPLNDGLWFEIENSTDFGFKELKIPQNVYRAVLEVYVSFHEQDEFWYSNFPNEYIEANNLTGTPGNGPFREVLVSLDDELVGSIWPFTVIYTGGVNPLLWRPITGIGSFNLPSYNIEITPFLGKVVDGKTHKIGFNVTNALNVWYIDANLHLWLDRHSVKTEGELLKHVSLPLVISLVSNYSGFDGKFLTSLSRSIESTGWVKSSYGNVTTNAIQDFYYNNTMVIGSDGNEQIVSQRIHFNDSVCANSQSSRVHLLKSLKKFTLFLYSDNLDQGNETYLSISNVTLGFDEKNSEGSFGFGFANSNLTNLQSGQGNILVKKNLVVRGLGSTQQVYSYNGADLCYFRNISSSNYTILYDKVESKCSKTTQSRRGFGFNSLWPFHARKVSL